ncbi:hypothetical protein J7E97_00970 [Streptomyces sp. ISL-66]|uniref:hypothetical protein n=1 Tax=Streptomyces sp. ISL-66 TaxID=2819186 RepID=UPI001BE6531E|nr:hypothetical protein [Streptomyces sp. ISL-66]MBT2466468.1 hypothetical protein [Streptomyces sp. ISL-66]
MTHLPPRSVDARAHPTAATAPYSGAPAGCAMSSGRAVFEAQLIWKARGENIMAEKIIDVTLASITNTGTRSVSPYGGISARSVRVKDPGQTFQSGLLYYVEAGKPIHESGVLSIKPGKSLTYNSTQRLSIFHFDALESGGFNQMLMIDSSLWQHMVTTGGSNETFYFAGRKKVFFVDLEGFFDFPWSYRAQYEDDERKFEANYTVNLISSSG